MPTKQRDSQTIRIPTLGPCTLLPLSSLPERIRSYEHILTTAQALGLKEIRKPSHQQIEEAKKAVARYMKQTCSVWISGIVHGYPKIFLDGRDQSPEKCLMSIELFLDQTSLMETCLDYVPVETSRRMHHRGEVIMCLFKGAPSS